MMILADAVYPTSVTPTLSSSFPHYTPIDPQALPMMRARRRGACVLGTLLVTARAMATTVTVDDGDPGIEYRGAWTHNPWGNQSVNYGSSVTFTNTSGSTATYRFQGTAIAVFGAFEMSGTYNVHSSYSIDDGTATDFIPADTFVVFQYNQKFFQSGTLSNDEHTLVITNLGEEFWLDYLVVTQSPPSTTTTTQSAAPQTPAIGDNTIAFQRFLSDTEHTFLFKRSKRYTHIYGYRENITAPFQQRITIPNL
ncbi:hypothetical protein GSI_08535 [Ganoderma sinense ZZ0214-1]|uniref:Uncharacterized protein n=1 Tax=Ganoderma sinense ZZ0214-1 TaxID=1077348 RepID=A0A2G8S442_9APHY|nr:hypothetical protein GSI_08535 [Ganoderma sinense ZZ0214-1]